jgi:protein-disulfide isomerase
MNAARGDAGSRRLGLRGFLDLVASIAMIAAAGVILWGALRQPPAASAPRPSIPVPAEPLSLEGAPVLGSLTAPVGIIEFADFECPYCSRFTTETLPELRRKYIDAGKVLVAFRHLPLPNHQRAQPAAISADCAAQQGRFWPMHDRLFVNPRQLADADLAGHAVAAGLDMAKFNACVATQSSDGIDTDIALARRLKISGTPTFFIGPLLAGASVNVEAIVAGAKPLADFADGIERVIAGLSKEK